MEALLSMFKAKPADISGLLAAIQSNELDDTLSRFMPQADWLQLAPYLDCEDLDRGHILTAKGALDRTLYFIESGRVRIHYGDKDGEYVVANLGPGNVVGEGTFFSELQRNATVQASTPCRVWSLTPEKFTQLRKVQPTVALSLAMALGATVSMRMLNVTQRIAVT